MDRIILHCDCNGFYASVELMAHPQLRDKPMAVGGSEKLRHGIILAKNEIAKRYGVKTAETIWQAKRKCPDLVLLPPHHEKYREYSAKVNAIYLRYTDRVEPFGIDESWLDVTDSIHLFGGDPQALADRIRKQVREEIGLTVSVGVSFNKVFAKLGSDYKKPDATTLITRELVPSIVYPLPVGALLYVGKATERTLTLAGIHTIGQLAAGNRDMLRALLGKMGETLHDYACGNDQEPVRLWEERREVKSVGNGLTFPEDLEDLQEIDRQALRLANKVASRLRKEKLLCTSVQVTLRDPDFRTITRQKALKTPTHSTHDIHRCAMELILQNRKAPIRMLTVTAQNLLSQNAPRQISWLEEETEDKREAVEQAMDSIRQKYGEDAIQFAGMLQKKKIDEKELDTEEKV